MKRIVIVDYGLGNMRSVVRGLEKSGAVPCITSEIEEIAAAEGIVLPGVGAFRDGMQQLGEMREALVDAAGSVPILGICLGMQMLMEWSEEHGMHKGIALIPGRVKKFPRVSGYKIPHMGWNSLHVEQPDNPLFAGFGEAEYVYFVHSYYVDTPSVYSLTTTDYICSFSSSVGNRSVFGVQFHPEKSGSAGLRLLGNFIDQV